MVHESAHFIFAVVMKPNETFVTQQRRVVRQPFVAFHNPVAKEEVAGVAEVGTRLGPFNQRVDSPVPRVARAAQTEVHESYQMFAAAEMQEHVRNAQADLQIQKAALHRLVLKRTYFTLQQITEAVRYVAPSSGRIINYNWMLF